MPWALQQQQQQLASRLAGALPLLQLPLPLLLGALEAGLMPWALQLALVQQQQQQEQQEQLLVAAVLPLLCVPQKNCCHLSPESLGAAAPAITGTSNDAGCST
jgi:hypothetical protein